MSGRLPLHVNQVPRVARLFEGESSPRCGAAQTQPQRDRGHVEQPLVSRERVLLTGEASEKNRTKRETLFSHSTASDRI